MSAIANSAGFVAAAQVGVERTAGVLAEAETARDLVKTRIAEKQAERAEIVAARKAGTESPKDAGRLLVIAADTENLEGILADAQAVVSTRTAAADEAKRQLAQAKNDLARRTDEELVARLVKHAGELDGLLLATIREIDAAAGRLGKPPGREPWVPTVQLVDAFRRRELTKEFRK